MSKVILPSTKSGPRKVQKYVKAGVLWLFMCFFEKDFEKCVFVIYSSMAIYTPLVGQKKFGICWTTGWWLDKTWVFWGFFEFWVFLGPDFVVGNVIFDFSWTTFCWIWIFLFTSIKWFLLEKIAEMFWGWRKLYSMRNLIYI